MSQQQDDAKTADPGRLSEDLSRSLRRCSGMVRDYRSRLIAANSNNPPSFILGPQADKPAELDAAGEDGERMG